MRKNIFLRVWTFYVEGFKQMTLGKTLWTLILLKLFVMFVVLRMIFFPNFLNQKGIKENKEEYVARELIERGMTK